MTYREIIKAELQNLQRILEAKADMCIGNGKVKLLSFANACSGALELLKEQEVIPHKNYAALDLWWCGCGWCIGKRGTFNYCPNCGKAVKWND